jgi:5-methyltetrahydropteroyltriglutamate--homocysteine methyltransferase
MGRPFRADQVGSLLRPAALLEARAGHTAGTLSDDELKAAEDAAIREVIRRQEEVGLKAITDGEFRRENWSLDFFAGLEGTTVVEVAMAPTVHGSEQKHSNVLRVPRVTGKIGAANHPMIEHIRFVLENTGQTAKLTVPCPTMLASASRDWRQMVDEGVYDGLDEFFADLGAAYAHFVRDVHAAGCRYLQLDDVNMAYLCDPAMRTKIADRGDNPDELLGKWITVLNTALAARPADMTMTTHICRGNFKSNWFAEGGYEPIAERLLNELDYDGFFLEYDSDRAGGFEPLRFLPKGDKRVVLGIVTSKTGALEDRDMLRARIDEASAIAPLDQLCISPQCGFASTEEGNTLAEEQQWAKLRQLVELAEEIWPDA